ncbi:MAG TPA: outer membrane beta-barrel protein [Kofleriaceae bacterium]|nr:outer membrane beta-barrel protein [Kofleriaceae bacterium]
MRTTKTLSACLGLAATLLIGGTALAQETQPYGEEDDSYQMPRLMSEHGMSAMIGGGVFGFTDPDTTDFIDVGSAWEARFAFGTREMIGTEVAYTGSAQNIDAAGLDGDAVLVSTGLEALARMNVFGRRAWQPYAVAGIGWRRYDVTNADFNTSSVRADDNVLEIPLGVGVAYRVNQLVLDVRGTFRPTLDNDLIAETPAEPDTQLHNWAATARVGFEF